ncbi:hypothetical protein LINPERPRIM_LOCUS37553 [Linum perenne]
MVTAPLTRLW